jgi:hypothetical protein
MPATDLEAMRAGAEERLNAFRLSVDDVTDADVRFIASVIDFIDAQVAAEAEQTTLIRDVLHRHTTGGAESVTPADIDALNRIRQSHRPVVRELVGAVSAVWHDFHEGRCSVCAMTAAQARAAGYDCAEEC